MQIEKFRAAAKAGIALAAYLDERSKVTRRLADLTGASLTVALDVEAVESLANLLRQHIEAIGALADEVTRQTERARASELAVADGMAMVALIRSSTLAELTSFWHRQRANQ